MSELDWAVLLQEGSEIHIYGPMEAVEAQAFARFMTKEVGPAMAFKLKSPLREVLGWHESEIARNDCTHSPGCPVHTDPGCQYMSENKVVGGTGNGRTAP